MKKNKHSSFVLRTYTEMDPKPGETIRQQKVLTVIASQEEESSVTLNKNQSPL